MKANRIINHVYRKHLGVHGLTNAQISVLFLLGKKGSVTQTELSRFFAMEKSTVSRNMKLLINLGLIIKEKKQLIITEAGRQKLEEVIPAWEAAMKELKKKLKKDGEEAVQLVLERIST